MAVLVLTSTYLSLNSSDLSAYAKKIELTVDVEDLDSTDFASGGWREHVGGLKAGTVSFDANDDFAAAALDAIMWPLLGTVVSFEVRPTSAAVGTSNPKWTGSVLITGHNAGGGVGELAQKTYSFPTSGTVTRATA